MNQPALPYTIYIATSAEKLWRGLTDPDLTEQYFGGNRAESDWRVGSDFILRMRDGQIDVKGKIPECRPPNFITVA